MNLKEYKYTEEHEWICPESGNRWRVGLTDYAQSSLGDVVYIDNNLGTDVKGISRR